MKLDKNGYKSEKRDAFATAVKVLTFILGVGVVVVAVCMYAVFSGCGSGGESGASVYDENGNCTENCNGNGDASTQTADSYYPAGDSCNGDTCSTQPQYDTTTGACEAIKAGKKPPEICMPSFYRGAHCSLLGQEELCPADDYNYPCPACNHTGEPCSTEAECQKIPCEDWPPEVCWGLPCMLVGKWDCGENIADLTDAEFYDDNKGNCRIHDPSNPEGDLYFKPGDDHVQRPASGPFEEKYTIINGGSQLFSEGGDGFTNTCTKLVEE